MSDAQTATVSDNAAPAPPSAREVELTEIAQRDGPTYHYANGGALAKEHLSLKRARETADGKAQTDAAEPPSFTPDELALLPEGQGGLEDDELEVGDYELEVDGDGEADERAADANGESAEETDGGKIPSAPEEYVEAVTEELPWTEGDPLVDEFAAFAHQQKLPQQGFDVALKFVEQIRARRHETDAANRAAAQTVLETEWGDAFSSNIKAFRSALKSLPEELAPVISKARGPTGDLLANDPRFIRWILSTRQGQREAAAPDAVRLEEITKIRNNDITRYRHERNGKGETLAEEALRLSRKRDAARSQRA